MVRTVLCMAAALAFACPALAQPAEWPPALKKVPTDAALFGHVDVAAVWPSKIGDTLRAAMSPQFKKRLGELSDSTGITPETVKSVTIFFRQIKGPGDTEAPVIHVAFLKPYDKNKVLGEIKKQLPRDDELKESEPGVYSLVPKRDQGRDNTEPVERFTVVLSDPMSITFAGQGARKYLVNSKTDEGPITPALQAAAKGATAVLAMNMDGLPDEIRGDQVPAEIRPFQPLFKSDMMFATGKLDGNELKFDIRFRSTDKPRTLEAEKSLGAGLLLAQTALAAAVKQLERGKTGDEQDALPLAKQVVEALKTVRIAVDGPDAVASGSIRADLPYGPLVRELVGGTSDRSTAAARASSSNNLKQIALALHNYHDANGALPPAMLVDTRGKPMLSWRVMILPYVEQSNLYQKFKLDEPWDSEHNKKVFEENPMPKVFALPGVSKEGEKTTYYQALVGNGALFDAIRTTKFAAISDGLSNTIMVATAARPVPWTKPDDIAFDTKVDPRTLLHLAGEGCSVALGDGSVRFLAKSIDAKVLKAMITRNGGEVIARDP